MEMSQELFRHFIIWSKTMNNHVSISIKKQYKWWWSHELQTKAKNTNQDNKMGRCSVSQSKYQTLIFKTVCMSSQMEIKASEELFPPIKLRKTKINNRISASRNYKSDKLSSINCRKKRKKERSMTQTWEILSPLFLHLLFSSYFS